MKDVILLDKLGKEVTLPTDASAISTERKVVKPGRVPVAGGDIVVSNSGVQELTAAVFDAGGYEYGTK